MLAEALPVWDIEPDIEEESGLSPAQCVLSGKHGIDIPNEQYHSMAGISGSNLELLANSNKHLDNKVLFNLDRTDALVFGSLVHTLTLEPHLFSTEFVISPKFDLRTSAGKIDKAAFDDKHDDKTVIKNEDFLKASKMARNVIAICGDVIDQGKKERSYFSDYDGLLLKIRPDIYVQETGADWDVKTISPKNLDMSDKALERHILNMGYHISAGFRNIVRKSLGMKTGDFYFIFASTSTGHLVRPIKIANEWVSEAENYVNELLNTRRFYLESGIDTGIKTIDRSSRKYEI